MNCSAPITVKKIVNTPLSFSLSSLSLCSVVDGWSDDDGEENDWNDGFIDGWGDDDGDKDGVLEIVGDDDGFVNGDEDGGSDGFVDGWGDDDGE